MKTFILASLLALTAVSGAVVTSQPAAAGGLNNPSAPAGYGGFFQAPTNKRMK